MTTTLAGIKALLKTKLESIVDTHGDSVFGDIFDYPQGDFGKYPAIVIMPTGSDGTVLDTARNERVFHFSLNLYQEQSQIGKTKQEASDIMTAVSDKIFEAFDQDPYLSDEVEFVKVVKASFNFMVQQGTFSFATFQIDCAVIVDNH